MTIDDDPVWIYVLKIDDVPSGWEYESLTADPGWECVLMADLHVGVYESVRAAVDESSHSFDLRSCNRVCGLLLVDESSCVIGGGSSKFESL